MWYILELFSISTLPEYMRHFLDIAGAQTHKQATVSHLFLTTLVPLWIWNEILIPASKAILTPLRRFSRQSFIFRLTQVSDSWWLTGRFLRVSNQQNDERCERNLPMRRRWQVRGGFLQRSEWKGTTRCWVLGWERGGSQGLCQLGGQRTELSGEPLTLALETCNDCLKLQHGTHLSREDASGTAFPLLLEF